MGLDFMRKAAKTFQKSRDKDRLRLTTATLFTQELTFGARSYTAKLTGQHLVAGEKLRVCIRKGQVVAIAGHDVVAEFSDPTPELRIALENSYCEAIGCVDEVYEMAGIVEITICN